MTNLSKASSANRTPALLQLLALAASSLYQLQLHVSSRQPQDEQVGTGGDSTLIGSSSERAVDVEKADSTLLGTASDQFDSTSKQAEEGQVVEEDGRDDSTLSPTVGRVALVHMPVHCTVQCICQLAG